MNLRILAALCSVLLLAGCSAMPDLGSILASTRTVEVEELRRTSQCGTLGEASSLRLFADQSAVRAWERAQQLDLIGAEALPPASRYLLVEHGARNTAGYGLAVSRSAQLTGRSLQLNATYISPPSDGFTAQVLTSPCVLIGLPAMELREVELVDQTGKTRARWPD